MTKWQTVPVDPDARMATAFAAEIRRQAGKLTPGTTAHEPLQPLWAAVLSVAPSPPFTAPLLPQTMPRTAAEGWNAAILAMIGIASKSAADITAAGKRPLAEGFAVAALSELAQSGRALLLPIGGTPDPSTSVQPSPSRPSGSPAAAAVRIQEGYTAAKHSDETDFASQNG